MPARGWRRVFRLDHGARHIERDVNAEIAFHLEMRTRKLIAAGWDPAAAREKAVAQFGDLPAMRDECLAIDYDRERAMRWSDLLSSVRQDVRYAIRSLRTQPSFTLTVVLILAIGIGANAAIFTLIDSLLLRTLPVPHAEQLVIVGDPGAVGSNWTGSPSSDIVSYPLYVDLRDRNNVVSGLYAAGTAGDLDVMLGTGTAADHPRGRLVTGNFFSVLEIPAYIGRTFTAEEDRVRLNDPVAVLSYGYWQRQFGGSRSAIDRVITVNGVRITIIGVTPPSFAGDIVGDPTDLWMPMMMEPAIRAPRDRIGDRSSSWLQVMGRLAPGVTLERARTVLTTLASQSIRTGITGIDLTRLEEDLAQTPIRVEPGARGFSRYRVAYGPALLVLMAAVGVVVLVVCANVANLMLVRAAGRGREMTVRMTLGAGRARLIQQLLIETMLIAVVAGGLGLLAAAWGSRALLASVGVGPTAAPLDVAPDARVVAFTAGVTLLSAVLFGLVPALGATRLDLATALRGHGRNLAGARARFGRFAAGKALVVGQVGLSTLLLIGTGLLVRSMQRILTADLGLDRDHIVLIDVSAGKAGYVGPRFVALMHDLVDRVQRVPGVVAASYSRQGVFSGGESTGHVTIPGFVFQADSQGSVNFDNVGPNYFHALGAHLLRGRDFETRDSDAGASAAVINETSAKFYFRGLDPVGRSIIDDDGVAATIIGVVQDIQENDVRGKPVRRVYLPRFAITDHPQSSVLEVRVAGDASHSVASLRTAVLAADRRLSIEIAPLGDRIRASVARDALVMRVTAIFGVIALVLSALGLYGVTAYATTQRTGELGLRAALGAEPADVMRMILREAVGLAFVGVLVGIPAGLAATRLIRGHMFGVGPVDLPSLGTAVAVLIGTALMASYLPARRAARVGPLEALRTD
jgi:predicted permease